MIQCAQGALAERLERYAKASGHPRLMELLTRHANEQKEKFTLSDDENEDEVRTITMDTGFTQQVSRYIGGFDSVRKWILLKEVVCGCSLTSIILCFAAEPS